MAAGAKDQIRKVLEAAKFIKIRFPEFSSLIESIRIIESCKCKFAYANVGVIGFNPVALIPLSQPDVRGILLHEIGHHYFDLPIIPVGTPREVNAKLQIIHDVFINDRLKDYYIAIKSEFMIERSLFPETFGLPSGKSFEYYNTKLIKKL